MKVFSEDIRRKFTGEINLILEMFHLDNTGLVLFRDKNRLLLINSMFMAILSPLIWLIIRFR